MAVYFNNAATTYPKPAAVAAAMARELESLPREMGRAAEGNDSLAICRQEVAAILGVADPRQVILVPSATQGLNLVIQGLLSPGKAGSFAPAHVITSVLEHNSVLRPLKQLAGRGCDRSLADTALPEWMYRRGCGPKKNSQGYAARCAHPCVERHRMGSTRRRRCASVCGAGYSDAHRRVADCRSRADTL